MGRAPILALLGLLTAVAACEGGTKPNPALDHFRQPSGLAISPDGGWLFVTGGNWDQHQDGGTLVAVDLAAVHAGLERPGGPQSGLTRDQPCRHSAGGGPLECDESFVIEVSESVVLGDAVGDVVLDQPGGEDGRWRLLVVQRRPAAIVWVDAVSDADGLRLECGQGEGRTCDDEHRLRRARDEASRVLPQDPSRIVLDDQGFRFAYVPHLLGASLSLIDLDGEFGPELSAVEPDFFRPSIDEELEAAGGFSVAARACNPDRPLRSSRDCSRPVLYSTQRFWPGTRRFAVAPGLEVILPGTESELAPVGVENVESRPLMGDLAFEDPGVGDDMLVVQTTPGALARVDTRVDAEGGAVDTVQSTVALCNNPNVLAVHRPDDDEALALVSCFGDGLLAVVGLGTFTVLRTLEVGAGPNEIEIDTRREQAYVANTRDHTISIVDLSRRRATFLTVWAQIGLAPG